MNQKYVSEVQRYGGPNPRVDKEGNSKNVRHIDHIRPDDVITDGSGNITSMPLLRKKPCFGRPERALRGLFEKRPWTDDNGEIHSPETPCYTCEKLTPDTFQSCHDVVVERIESSATIESVCNHWFDETGSQFGKGCFNGKSGKLWHDFLDAIEKHGGWTNANDMQVKLDAIAAETKRKRQRADKEKTRRRIERKRRQGLVGPLTSEFYSAVDKERDRRSSELKSLRGMQGKDSRDLFWISSTPDTTWERVAEVWRARELLRKRGGAWKNKDIAEMLNRLPAYITKSIGSLQARVSEDLKRIEKLESDTDGEPIWPAWSFRP